MYMYNTTLLKAYHTTSAIVKLLLGLRMHIMPRAKECQSGSSMRIGAGMVPGMLYIRVCMRAGMRMQVLIDISEA